MGRNAEENERNQKKKPHCRIVVWDAMTTSVCLFISSQLPGTNPATDIT
jgi:hypothetical protein